MTRMDSSFWSSLVNYTRGLVDMLWIERHSYVGSVASFRLRRWVVWSLPLTQGAQEASDAGAQRHRGAGPSGQAAAGRPLVWRLPPEDASRCSTQARPRG